MKLSALAAMLAAVVLASPPVRSAGPRLVPHVRAGRHAFGGQPGQLLVVCPTPGCSTPLRPDKVASHLLKCPVLAEQRALEASGYYLRGCNTGASEVDDSADVAPLTPEVAAALEAQLRAVHEAEMGGRLVHTAAAPSPFMATASVKERERQRQRLQRSAIADQLAALGVLGQGHCIVELGAGNGELSLSIAEAYPEVRSDALVLLDARSKPKGKAGGARLAADPALRERFGSVARVKLGLEDTELRGPRPPGRKRRPGRSPGGPARGA